jgi:hypothetical protein
MASPACPTRTARRPSAPGSGATRSASSTSTSPRSTPSRAASICSSPSAVSRRLIRSSKDRQQRCRWPAGPGGDRTSKFAFAQLHEKATRRAAADFLHALAVPYRIHTVLTDNGTQFVDRTPTNEAAEAAAEAYWAVKGEPRVWLVHAFDHACDHACEQPCSGLAAAPSGGSLRDGIDHRTTKPAHPLRRLLPAVPAGSGSMACPSGSSEPDSAADG